MPKQLGFIIAGIVIASAFAIPSRPADTQADVPARAMLGVPFQVAVNETMAVAGSDISVKFYNVTEDSRCPADVVCIWAGQVTAMVGLTQNSTDLGRFNLTLGAGSNASMAEQKAGGYTVRLTQVEPYPISSQPTSPGDYVATLVLTKDDGHLMARSAIVMAVGSRTESPAIDAFIVSWSVEREAGVAVALIRDSGMAYHRVVAKFLPYEAPCEKGAMSRCIDGQITSVTGSEVIGEGDFIHFKTDAQGRQIQVSFKTPMNNTGDNTGETNDYTLEIKKFKEVSKPYIPNGSSMVVTLKEGQREGPLLVQRILADRVEGLNYPEYPVAMDSGLPITLHVGERASNGCTVWLTLVRIEDGSATFVKKVDENRPCPICWVQLDLMSGWR